MWSRHQGRDQRGAAAVETALCICFIVLPLTFATIAYAYMFSFRQALSQAASEGARAAVGATTNSVAVDAAKAAVSNALNTYGMTCQTTGSKAGPACVFTWTPSGCALPARGCVLSVELDYPYRAANLLPTIPGLGFTLPSNLSFTSAVQVS